MSNLYLAANQYASRPADERYRDLSSLLAACQGDDARCRHASGQLRTLRAKAEHGEVVLNGKTNSARLSHWSFGQLAGLAGAPGAYLRTLPAALAADCLNTGLDARQGDTPNGTTNGNGAGDLSLYIEAPDAPDPATPNLAPGARLPLIRSINGPTYARVRDSAIVSRLVDLQDTRPDWQLPMTWAGTREGAYRGDRDSFVILTNGGSIVEDPTLRNRQTPAAVPDEPHHPGNGAAMYRGIIVRNSEVGACSLQFHYVLFRFICGNHIIWDVAADASFRRRHVGQAGADFVVTLSRAIRDLVNRPESADTAIIQSLAAKAIGKDEPEVLDALRELGATDSQAKAAYLAAEQYETDPRSAWGLMNGITRISQTASHADGRLTLDLLAAKLAQKYSRVAA